MSQPKEKEGYCALHDSYGERLDKVEDRQEDIRNPDTGILVKIASSQKWLKGYLAAVMVILLGGYYYTNVVNADMQKLQDKQDVVISRLDSQGDVKGDIACLRKEVAELKLILLQDKRERRN